MQVMWQTTGPTQEWLPVRQYSINKNAYVGTFNTGKTISVYDGIVPGRTVHVVYSRQPQEMLLASDDFEDVTLLPSYAKEPVVLGAAYRMASFMDVGRLPSQAAEVDQIDQQSPVGSGGTVTREAVLSVAVAVSLTAELIWKLDAVVSVAVAVSAKLVAKVARASMESVAVAVSTTSQAKKFPAAAANGA